MLSKLLPKGISGGGSKSGGVQPKGISGGKRK